MIYQDETAEKAILGAALLDPRITVTTQLGAGEFGHTLHAVLWQAITNTHRDGVSPDPSTLRQHIPANQLAAALQLATEVASLGIPANAQAYAATIRDRAERTRIGDAIRGIEQRIDDLNRPPADTLAWAEQHLLTTTSLDAAVETLFTLDEFLDRELPPMSWVIPDLLAVGDRFVLTGIEGFGKSMLMRQIGVCAAAGLHPFTLASIPPKRVLYVDCENPERIMMSKLGTLRDVIRTRGVRDPIRFSLKRYPQGLDLADPKDRLDIHHLLSLLRPDLLMIGPAYKLYVGGSNTREEDLARLVTKTLDAWREEFGFALILEHHSPHGSGEGQRSVRPIGSSLWLRWPEFGMGIRPQSGTKVSDRAGELAPWRGSRDERPWPTLLETGGPGSLPWIDPHLMHPQARRTA